MEPIPETSRAIDEFGPFSLEGDLLETFRSMSERVGKIVPDCVGLSLESRELGVTFTLVAASELIASRDAVQYVSDGPCVTSVEDERVIAARDEDLFNERRWQLFARATTSAAVCSTLTLPIVIDGRVTGSINLYASSPDAFAGHHSAIAEIFGAWAPGAVTNADLDFATRNTAQQAPRLLYEEIRVHVAVGVLVSTENLSVEAARQRLEEAALRAGVSQAVLAETLIGAAIRHASSDE